MLDNYSPKSKIFNLKSIRKPLINNQIRTPSVRVIDEEGKQLGIMDLRDALRAAIERGLDLIQVTEKAETPVCKIMDYGKYLYWQQKKEKGVKKTSEIKGIRLGFSISIHDIETRVRKAEEFLRKGNRVKVEMVLRGREKRLSDFAKEKVKLFIEMLIKKIPIKVDRELKREGRGLMMIISKQ